VLVVGDAAQAAAWDVVTSPLGDLLVTVNGAGALCGLRFVDDRAPESAGRHDVKRCASVREQLAAYFEGALREFSLDLAPNGTPFQQAVWREVARIPFGQTVSYGEVARRLGKPEASRAVGLANGANPIAIVIPCHRVIGADGSLAGYGGGLERKRWLLRHEGALAPQQLVLDLG
jgi:methylated-DNA-[protein]-cysteine S-methyltransferase